MWRIVCMEHFYMGLMQAAAVTYFGMNCFSKVGFKAIVSKKIESCRERRIYKINLREQKWHFRLEEKADHIHETPHISIGCIFERSMVPFESLVKSSNSPSLSQSNWNLGLVPFQWGVSLNRLEWQDGGRGCLTSPGGTEQCTNKDCRAGQPSKAWSSRAPSSHACKRNQQMKLWWNRNSHPTKKKIDNLHAALLPSKILTSNHKSEAKCDFFFFTSRLLLAFNRRGY